MVTLNVHAHSIWAGLILTSPNELDSGYFCAIPTSNIQSACRGRRGHMTVTWVSHVPVGYSVLSTVSGIGQLGIPLYDGCPLDGSTMCSNDIHEHYRESIIYIHVHVIR